MIIYIIISSKVTNTSTLPLNQEGILSLHSHQHIQSSLHCRVIIIESQSHNHSFFHYRIIILSLYHTICHQKFLQIQPFFILDVGLVLFHVFITSRARHHVGIIHNLIYISMKITCILYLLLVISRSSLLSYTRQRKTNKASTVDLRSIREPPRYICHAL